MAYESLLMQPSEAARSSGASEYLKEVLNSSKQQVIETSNQVPGHEYFFDGLCLKWRISDEQAFRKFWQRTGLDNNSINYKVEQIRTEPVAINYQYLHDLCTGIHKGFHQLFGQHLPSFSAPMGLTFQTVLQAGATPLPDGSNAVTVCAEFFNFERWFALRSLFDQIFPIFRPSQKDREISLSPEQQRMLGGFIEGMHLLSRTILRDDAISRKQPLISFRRCCTMPQKFWAMGFAI